MKKIKQFFLNMVDSLRTFFMSSFEPKEEEKSSMELWAEEEVRLACVNERLDQDSSPEGEWDYGCACYESALKVFKSLLSDRHSGFSIGMTKRILVRLIDGRPLTPIVESMDSWNETHHDDDGSPHYQSKRMSSLFKNVRGDGSYKYEDIDASYCVDIHTKSTYHNGFVQREIFDKMFPVTFPYMPTDPSKIFCEDLLTDPKNGDFDTIGVFYILKPEYGGKVNQIDINRFFKESGEGWAEITAEEYAERKILYQKYLAELEAKKAAEGANDAT